MTEDLGQIFAVALVLQKIRPNGLGDLKLMLAHYDATSANEALGIAISRAEETHPDYRMTCHLVSCAEDVIGKVE
jgi:hypothetical protein